MLVDDGVLIASDGQAAGELTAIAVPPTIQALLAARLDRLEPRERAVIEAASVEGKEFTRERVAALWTTAPAIHRRPAAGARPQGPHPARRRRMRETSASATSCPRRRLRRDAQGAARRAARALRGLAGGAATVFPVVDELLGYHVERAVRLRRELGETEEATAELAARASAHSAPPACAPPSATIRWPRARCWSARPPSPRATTWRAERCSRPGGLALRGGPLDAGHQRARRGHRPGPGTEARGAREDRARVRAPRVRGGRGHRAGASGRRRGAPGARARGRPCRAVPGLVPARPGRLDRRARRAGRLGVVRGRGLRASRARRPRAVPDSRHARDRGRARPHAGGRRDRPLPGVPRARRGESRGGRPDGQPARVPARHAG